MFPSRSAASKAAGLSRSASHHWYTIGVRRIFPGTSSLLNMAKVQGLTDAEIGRLVQDVERQRNRIYLAKAREQAARTRKETRLRQALKEERERNQKNRSRLDRALEVARSEEIRQKEEFLDQENDADILDRMIRIIQGD